jgi:hypothetical protein
MSVLGGMRGHDDDAGALGAHTRAELAKDRVEVTVTVGMPSFVIG